MKSDDIGPGDGGERKNNDERESQLVVLLIEKSKKAASSREVRWTHASWERRGTALARRCRAGGSRSRSTRTTENATHDVAVSVFDAAAAQRDEEGLDVSRVRCARDGRPLAVGRRRL